MALPRAADEHQRQNRRIAAVARLAIARLWRQLPNQFDEGWASLAPRVLTLLMGGQLAMAREAQRFVPDVLDFLNIDADPVARSNPFSVVGVAGSGVPLAELLAYPVIQVKVSISTGSSIAQAKESGGDLLDGIVQTQLSDAGRAIESVEMASRPSINRYVRMLTLPSCSRCVILAGRIYKWSTGFQRHPGCDCRMIPADEDVAGDIRTDPLAAIKAGDVGSYRIDPETGERTFQSGLSKADLRAIVEDGADPGQVINAHRGMQTAQVYGRSLKIAREGTTKSGLAGQRLGNFVKPTGPGATRYRRAKAPRLRPESIYQIADDREHALRLLYRNGYLLEPPQ